MTLRMNWGVGVVLFYTAFALSTLGFVAYAMTRDVELVADDYYARALDHDAHMRAVANAEALGTAFSVTVTPAGVVVQLPADMAATATGTATLYRPSDASADRRIGLAPAADGRVLLPIAGLAAGRWRLQVQWSVREQAYYAERELRLP